MDLDLIDLRSDTVTQADVSMRQAMADARVGDSMMGEDPTVTELESRMCSFFGFSYAAFMPSGTMSNQLALRALSEPGDAILAPAENHIVQFESGALAALAGLQLISAECDAASPHVIAEHSIKGRLTAQSEFYRPPLKLVAIENTSLATAGSVYDRQRMKSLKEICHSSGLKLHIDGARIWHALDGAEQNAHWLGSCSDSLSVCFSKGLGAPVGSIALLHKQDEFHRLKRFQKMYGGCMRQAGHLAAAALHAFDFNRPRLLETHAVASYFGELCKSQSGAHSIEYGGTNIVFAHTSGSDETDEIVQRFKNRHGILLSKFRSNVVRAVFHIDVNSAALKERLG
jgi:threonine aldolase